MQFHIPEELDVLVYIGLLMLLAQAAGRLSNYLRAPRLIGYLVLGIALGPSFLGFLSQKVVDERLGIITRIALAVIAFSIGGSLRLDRLRKLSRSIGAITACESPVAAAIVFAVTAPLLPFLVPGAGEGLDYVQSYLPAALVLGAVSAATAPAAILSLVHEYRASGPLTTTLLGVVAIDDAVALVLYAFAAAVIRNLHADDALTWVTVLGWPLAEIGLSLGIGAIVGLFLRRVIEFFSARDLLLGTMVGAVLFVAGVALTFNLSALLANMALGFVVANFVEHERADEGFEAVTSIEEPIFAMFFALAGAHLDVGVAMAAGSLVGLVTVGRFAGKLAGAWIGARLGRAQPNVRRYIGFGLLPAAGVTIGLVLEASALLTPTLPNLSKAMVSAVVGAVLINELLTPFFVRYALFRAGEARSQHELPLPDHKGRRSDRRSSSAS